jgi:hypothetical protein
MSSANSLYMQATMVRRFSWEDQLHTKAGIRFAEQTPVRHRRRLFCFVRQSVGCGWKKGMTLCRVSVGLQLPAASPDVVSHHSLEFNVALVVSQTQQLLTCISLYMHQLSMSKRSVGYCKARDLIRGPCPMSTITASTPSAYA